VREHCYLLRCEYQLDGVFVFFHRAPE
jgi:hypothetical protein